jgi:hypothetical protein
MGDTNTLNNSPRANRQEEINELRRACCREGPCVHSNRCSLRFPPKLAILSSLSLSGGPTVRDTSPRLGVGARGLSRIVGPGRAPANGIAPPEERRTERCTATGDTVWAGACQVSRALCKAPRIAFACPRSHVAGS